MYPSRRLTKHEVGEYPRIHSSKNLLFFTNPSGSRTTKNTTGKRIKEMWEKGFIDFSPDSNGKSKQAPRDNKGCRSNTNLKNMLCNVSVDPCFAQSKINETYLRNKFLLTKRNQQGVLNFQQLSSKLKTYQLRAVKDDHHLQATVKTLKEASEETRERINTILLPQTSRAIKLTGMKNRRTAISSTLNTEEKPTNPWAQKQAERDSFIRMKLSQKLGRSLKSINIDIEYGGGKIPLPLAVILEANKQIYLRWRKNQSDTTEESMKSITCEIIDKLVSQYKSSLTKQIALS
eukprot:TRINITY_DN9162_c0_g1_i1.p1 TRINITY_DN9162_c0_g1~~TRINITY_DN9162_c0_g1_i1.p1  ORF type:complete len:290 (-),score=37.88 TRINITY_DN9162_c0_g1_i1:3-872(-)